MVNSKHRSTLTDDHLTELLTALTTYNPDFKKLTKYIKHAKNKKIIKN